MRADEESWLVAAAADDPRRLAELRARVASGEPTAYVAGFIEYAGRRFAMDRRAFITDPESRPLLDQAFAEGRRLQPTLTRPLRVLEFGVGAGTLAITLKLAAPGWELWGLDVDPPALELARENALRHGVELNLLHSDYLSGWPANETPPDLIFGDPPWGDAGDVYADGRDARYYEQMPRASAFPQQGGRSGIHDELIRRLAASGWRSLLLLNYGMLPEDLIARSAAPLRQWQILQPRPGISLLRGRM
ncbi:MAG: methyltransferase [Xanthomonadales bacterium]|nr:Release factor glutamine methyltransferase [Xanthomonadales bacterium]MCC6592472.1 methyltransferase [Xanthomonadales bacterium]